MKFTLSLITIAILFCIFTYCVDKPEYDKEQITKDSVMVKSLHRYFKPSKLKKLDAGNFEKKQLRPDQLKKLKALKLESDKYNLIDAIASGSKLTKADAP